MVFLKRIMCTIIVNHLWKTHEAFKSESYLLLHMEKCMIC